MTGFVVGGAIGIIVGLIIGVIQFERRMYRMEKILIPVKIYYGQLNPDDPRGWNEIEALYSLAGALKERIEKIENLLLPAVTLEK